MWGAPMKAPTNQKDHKPNRIRLWVDHKRDNTNWTALKNIKRCSASLIINIK